LCTTCFQLFWSCWSPVRTFYILQASQSCPFCLRVPGLSFLTPLQVSATSSWVHFQVLYTNLVHKIYSDLRPLQPLIEDRPGASNHSVPQRRLVLVLTSCGH
jgi:hypothetical protein